MANHKIENFKIMPLKEGKFVKAIKIEYTQNGKYKSWEAVKSHDSVSILLYHTTKKAFVVVKQFRAPVYMHDKTHTLTYELCAGIVDKDTSLKQIAKEEIYEECGYEVGLNAIEDITSFYTTVGVSGAKQSLFFAKVDESMRIHEGGGIHDEEIEVDYISIDEAKEFIFDSSKAKTPGLMFAFYWFFENCLDR